MKQTAAILLLAVLVCVLGVYAFYRFLQPSQQSELEENISLYWQYSGDQLYDPGIRSIMLESGEERDYPYDGYLIEGDCSEGVYAVVDDTETTTCSIISLYPGKAKTIAKNLEKPERGRILSYRNGWIYYGKWEEDGIAFYRIDRNNAKQQYMNHIPASKYALSMGNMLDGFLDISRTWSDIDENVILKTCTISDDGKIAICIFDYNGIDPFYSENVEVIYLTTEGEMCSLGRGKKPVWLNNDLLMFERDEVLYIYNPSKNMSEPFVAKNGATISLQHSGLGSITLNREGTYLAYFQHLTKTNKFRGCASPQTELERAVVVSLEDGRTCIVEEIGASCRDRYWMLWG